MILAGLAVWLWPKRNPSPSESTTSSGSESQSSGPITSPRPLSLSRTETLEFVREWPETNFVRCIAFDYDGKSLFTGTSNGRLLHWKFDSNVPTNQLLKCPSALNAMAAAFINDAYKPRRPGRSDKHSLIAGRWAVAALSK
mgnify:CR=1 FL=1